MLLLKKHGKMLEINATANKDKFMLLKSANIAILTSVIFLPCCTYDYKKNTSENKSLIDYLDIENIDKYDVKTQEQMNAIIKKDKIFSEEYNIYNNGYYIILSKKEDPSQIFILNNKKFIAFFEKNSRVLYSEDTIIPTELDAFVKYFPNIPSISYESKKFNYYDFKLDGVDIISEEMPNSDISLDYLHSEILGTKNLSIYKAVIPNKECKALAGNIACCLSSKSKYDAYSFSYKSGWNIIKENEKIEKICNSKNFENERKKLKDILKIQS